MNSSGDATKPVPADAEPGTRISEANDAGGADRIAGSRSDEGGRAGDSISAETGLEEAIDKYLRDTGQEFPVGADAMLSPATLRRKRTDRSRYRSKGARTRNSMVQVVRRNVRPSPYMLAVIVATALTLAMWSVTLVFAFAVHADSPFAGYTLDRRQQVLGIVCLLALCSTALFVRAVWQICRGTRRQREFPPRKPALLRPPAVLRGIDAERLGSMCAYVALVLALLSCGLLAGTVSVILRGP